MKFILTTLGNGFCFKPKNIISEFVIGINSPNEKKK